MPCADPKGRGSCGLGEFLPLRQLLLPLLLFSLPGRTHLPHPAWRLEPRQRPAPLGLAIPAPAPADATLRLRWVAGGLLRRCAVVESCACARAL